MKYYNIFIELAWSILLLLFDISCGLCSNLVSLIAFIHIHKIKKVLFMITKETKLYIMIEMRRLVRYIFSYPLEKLLAKKNIISIEY